MDTRNIQIKSRLLAGGGLTPLYWGNEIAKTFIGLKQSFTSRNKAYFGNKEKTP